MPELHSCKLHTTKTDESITDLFTVR